MVTVEVTRGRCRLLLKILRTFIGVSDLLREPLHMVWHIRCFDPCRRESRSEEVSIFGWRAGCFFVLLLCLCASRNYTAQEQLTLLPNEPRPEPGIIVGNVNDDAIPGATVVLQGPT
jgi:hypothetical protein